MLHGRPNSRWTRKGVLCATATATAEWCKMHADHTSANRLLETCSLGFKSPSLIMNIHVIVN